MRRILGAVLTGLGMLLLVLAVALPFYVAPAVTKLPYDMVACPKPTEPQPSGCLKPSVVEAPSARFLQIKAVADGVDINVNTANLRATTEVLPQAKITADEQAAGRLGDNAVVWDVYSTVRRIDTNEIISASSTELAIDRVTGAAVDWKNQWLDESGTKDTTIKYTDQVYKFPFGTEKRDYKIFDTDLRTALPAKFTAVETIEGIEVYHFVQNVPDTQLPVPEDSVKTLLGRFVPEATSGQVFYRNTREVWVEPNTGAYLKVRERPHQELRPNTGATQVLLDADFVYTQDTIVNSAKGAGDNVALLKLVRVYLPIGAAIIGLLLLGGGIALLSGGRPKGQHEGDPGATDGGDGSWGADLPEARHQLRGEQTPAGTG